MWEDEDALWEKYMWLEGYCFVAGMGAVLVFMPVLGIWSGYQQNRRRAFMENRGRKKEEERQQQENHNRFNSITQKVKPENQNQEHNIRKEGIQPINQKR